LDTDYSSGNSYYYYQRQSISGSTYVNNFPTYSVPQNTNMGFSANFGLNLQLSSSAQSASYTFSIVASGSSLNNVTLTSQTLNFTSSVSNLSTTLVFNVTSSYRDFIPGDQVYFKLIQGTTSLPTNATASLTQTGNGTIYDGLRNLLSVTTTTGINPFATGSAGYFISSSNGTDTLILNKSLSSFIDYQYLPTTSSIGLYSTYGNINNTFSPKVGDALLLYYNGGIQYQEFNIININQVNGQYQIKLSPSLANNLALTGSYTSNTVDRFLLLSKQPDETNLYLSFNKTPGNTSYGFLIPDNLSPGILSKIDIITRQVQQKLLANGQGLTINTI
jgi:hypothetical protein